MASEILLDVAGLRVSFPGEAGRIDAVRGVDYDVRAGEVVAIVGESGSGKSVSSLAVLGLLPDQARVTGSIRFQGRELLGLGDRELSRLRGAAMSMVFQDPLSALTPVYRVGDQIAEALLVHGAAPDRTSARARAVELLELVGIDDAATRASAFPHEFSGGMRQRVVIAMAIANDPALIVCDEPTTALDVTVQAQILDLLRKARDITGAGVVFITHDMGIAATLADRVRGDVCREDRRIRIGGDGVRKPPDALHGGPARLDPPPGRPTPRATAPDRGRPAGYARPAPGCPFAPRCPLVLDACRAAEPALTEVESGHRAACLRTGETSSADLFAAYRQALPEPVAAPAPDPEIVLRVRDLRKTFPITSGVVFKRRRGEVRAVDGVSFEVRRGRTLALVGESGSGKSTTLTQIMDLVAPESGSIEVFGTDVARLTPAQRRAARRRLQIVFQDPTAALDPRMPVFDLLAEPLRIDGRGRAEVSRRVPELLDLVGLAREHAGRYPADFSGGQRQRINIARALALDPEVLVLDEPVSSLDVSIQAGVLNLLRRLQESQGIAYLFVSHDLSVVRNLAHDVAVMYRGRIVELGPAEEVLEHPQHQYTQALLAAVPAM